MGTLDMGRNFPGISYAEMEIKIMKQQNEQRNASNMRNPQQNIGQNKKNNNGENKKNNESQNEKLSNVDLHLNNNPQAY